MQCIASRADKTDSRYPLMTQSTRPGQLDSMRSHVCVCHRLTTNGRKSVSYWRGGAGKWATASVDIHHA